MSSVRLTVNVLKREKHYYIKKTMNMCAIYCETLQTNKKKEKSTHVFCISVLEIFMPCV